MLDLVTVGETMVAFIPKEQGFLRYVQSFGKKAAGAESNVAIGIAKLGHSSGWISKLGKDEFGEYILRELRGEGVDTSRVIRSGENPTGLMFKQFNNGGETTVCYYRSNSAASTLCPEEIDNDYIRQARIVHISGVTPALSPSCARTIRHIVEITRQGGGQVSFDPNIRLKLWDRELARNTLGPLLSQSDIVLLGEDEGEILLGTKEPSEMISLLRQRGVKRIAVKMGSQGAVVADMKSIVKIPAVKTVSVDNVGAGDAFNTGVLCGIIEGRDIQECGEMGALMGSLAVSTYGDVEGLPNREQFDCIRKNVQVIYR